jgi:hypothetical protein
MRTYYAAYRAYGVTTLNRDGNRADYIYTYPTRAERDTAVAADWEHMEPVTHREMLHETHSPDHATAGPCPPPVPDPITREDELAALEAQGAALLAAGWAII